MKAPTRVGVIELDRLAEVATLPGPADERYHGVWLLVTDQGRPVGELEFEFADRAGRPDVAALGDQLRRSAPQPPPPGPTPFVSVVLPTVFGRIPLLQEALAQLTKSDYPDFEIIVADNRTGSAAPVPDLGPAGADPRIRVVPAPRPGISAARNAGIEDARGEIIAFTDDDVMVDPGWLRALVGRLIAEPDADCVTSPVLPAELETAEQVWFESRGEGPARSYQPACYQIEAQGIGGLRPWDRRRFRVRDRYAADPDGSFWLYQLGPFGCGASMAWRTEALRRLGGFDEALGTGTPTLGGEDIALFVRALFAGRCLAFEPTAFVFHTHRRTYPELRRQSSGYGRGLTAMLTALIREDFRHLLGLLRVCAPAVRSFTGRTPAAVRRNAPTESADVPVGDLRRARLYGLINGPITYFWSRRRIRG